MMRSPTPERRLFKLPRPPWRTDLFERAALHEASPRFEKARDIRTAASRGFLDAMWALGKDSAVRAARVARGVAAAPAPPAAEAQATGARWMAAQPGTRGYSRDPAEAERLAGTVAGQRSERARIHQLHDGDGVQEAPRRRRKSTWSRAWRVWNETPLKWAPLPVLLGAVVLVGVQAHRQWQRNERIVSETLVDATGQPVRVKGPWSVR